MSDYCLDETQVGVLRRVEKRLYDDRRLSDDDRRDCANTLNAVLGSVAPYREVPAVSKTEQIAREHVKANATGLVRKLAHEYEDDWAFYLLHGESGAYEAFETWIVSHWLAKQLAKHGHRVAEFDYQHYWARPRAGQSVALDPVFRDIAKEVA